jgi:hypothetical protein
MTLERAVRQSFDEWADDAPTPAGLADDALRGRRRRRVTRGMTTVVAVAAVAAAVAVPTALLHRGSHTGVRVGAARAGSAWTPLPLSHAHTGNTTVSGHPDESPPVHLIAAYDTAVSAYSFQSATGNIWYLYDPQTGTYQRTGWDQLDVSPGMGLAAVLEGPARADRIGILDMRTRQVIRWIDIAHNAGTVQFSPDGTKLLAGTFAGTDQASRVSTGINGFIVIDLVTGAQTFRSLDPTTGPYGSALWTYDGASIYAPSARPGAARFFHADGTPAPTPPDAGGPAYQNGYDANVSPDGTEVNAGFTGHQEPQTSVADLGTGKIIGTQPVQDLEAWANNNSLIAWACDATCTNEFHSRLVLVNVAGTTVVPLSGFVGGNRDDAPERWHILATQR